MSQLLCYRFLGSSGGIADARAKLLLWERDADNLLQLPEIVRGDVFADATVFLPGVLYAAWARQMRGDHAAARAAFDAARVRLESALSELPDDWRVHAALGLAQAGLGRRDQALREARWLEQSVVYREDAYFGPRIVARDRAQILAQAGAPAGALVEIERVLAPSGLSVHELRLDPLWDPIRDDPQFNALLAKYGGR